MQWAEHRVVCRRRSHTHRVRILVPVVFAVAFATGCASSRLYEGRRELRRGNPQNALPLLRIARAQDPGNPFVLRELGIASYKLAEYDSAAAALEQAVLKRRRDARALFYLGASYERGRHYAAAIEAYRQYTVARGDKTERREMQRRLDALTQRQLQIDSRRALATETQLPGLDDPRTIAVSPFDAAGFAPAWSKVGRGVAALITNDLAQVRSLRVVDRLQLNVLLREVRLASPGAPASPGGDSSNDVPPTAAAPAPAPADPIAARVDVPADTGLNLNPVTSVAGIEQRLSIVRRPPSDPERPGQPYFLGTVKDVEDLEYFNALTAFQSDQGLTIDGIAGLRTRQALEAATSAALGGGSRPSPSATVQRPAPVEEPRRSALPPPPPPPSPSPVAIATVAAARPLLVEPLAAPRIGRILRAHTLVTGSVQALGGDDVRIDALPNSIYGAAFEPGSAQARGVMTRLFELEKRLVFDITERKMRLTLSEAERRAIQGARPPKIDAFLAFCDGLELESEARYQEAAAQFRRAADLDPQFQAARDAAQRNEDLVATEGFPDPEARFDVPADQDEIGSQIDRSLTEAGPGHLPGASEETETRPVGIGDPPAPPRPR